MNSIFYSNSFMDYIGDFLDKDGGIALSSIEKLVDLMKESRDKLVPKCMAITIISLSSADVQIKLCDSGVWNILFQWLQDGLKNDTTCFILEILRLYLTLPISFENLISNSCPKLIKKLTKNGNPEIISISKNIVAKWRKIVEERTSKDLPEVPNKKIKLDESILKDDKNIEEKKKIRTAKVRTTSFRSAGIEEQELDPSKTIKKAVKKVEEKPGMEELHQKVSATVDKRKVLEIHESKNFINSIMQTPAPPRKKKKRQDSGVNKSASDISMTEDGGSESANLKASPTPDVLSSSEKPKKRVSWAPTDALQSIKYFELDENERVNVNKVSIEEMKKKERMMERQHASHRLTNEDIDDDTQVEKWYKPLVVLGVPENKIEVTSVEKNIQFERERKVLKVLYFERDSIPYCPTEPDSEPYDVKDPLIIPLDDITSKKSLPKPPVVPVDANSKLLIYTEKEGGSECHLTLRPDVANLLKSMTQAPPPEPSAAAPPVDTSEAPQTRTKLISIIRNRYPDIDPEKLSSEEVCKLLEPMRDQLIREGILSLPVAPVAPTNQQQQPPPQNLLVPPPPTFNTVAAPPPWFNDPRSHFPRHPHEMQMMHHHQQQQQQQQRMPPMQFPHNGAPPPMHFNGPPVPRQQQPPQHMRPLCRFLAANGFCRAGNNCGFSHIMPDGAPPPRQFNNNRH